MARLGARNISGYEVVRLNYPHAGHSAGRPEIVPAWQTWIRNPTSGRDTEMGGTPAGNAESTLGAPPKILEFLAKRAPLFFSAPLTSQPVEQQMQSISHRAHQRSFTTGRTLALTAFSRCFSLGSGSPSYASFRR